ncbi:MAG: hypothetical protein PVF49_11125, partial [Anaerolineales bacterium]
TVSEREADRRRGAIRKIPDRIENESAKFFRRVRAEYRRRSRNRRQQIVIDSAVGADEVFVHAKRQIDRRLRRHQIA